MRLRNNKSNYILMALYTIIFILLSGILAYFITDYKYSVSEEDIFDKTLDDNDEGNVNFSGNSLYEMQEVYSALGQGINIGNSLDACDWSYFGTKSNAGFQTAIVYNTDPWTAWDASDYLTFDNSGNIKITWKLKALNSSSEANADNFAFQLVNHREDYQGTNVTCKVTNMKLTLKNGVEEDLLSGKEDTYYLTIKDDVTEYIYFDFPEGMKTSDIAGATVDMALEISDYKIDNSADIEALEKSWGNVPIKEDMITSIKLAGFNTVRIPITYFNHISNDGIIDEYFLDRVEQVVDWVLENDMYCIIDVHHDSGNDGWIKASEQNYEHNKDLVYSLFVQIAQRFKDKDYRLILEGLNEVVNDNTQWEDIPREDLSIVNEWNQLFVDAVRSTGGKNIDRYILVNTYAALPLYECLNSFELPEDIVEDKIFVGIHCYFDKEDIATYFSVIRDFSAKYKFVIGEWAVKADVPDRELVIQELLDKAGNLSIPLIWWDNGNPNDTGLIDRNNNTWIFKNIVDEILRE